jgi:hypothetical protein
MSVSLPPLFPLSTSTSQQWLQELFYGGGVFVTVYPVRCAQGLESGLTIANRYSRLRPSQRKLFFDDNIPRYRFVQVLPVPLVHKVATWFGRQIYCLLLSK